MKLSFTKMHGLGNDFVIFDFTQNAIELSAQQAAFIADRHFGVGCDQILLIEKPSNPKADFKYRILNANGSEVGQCGNGARCFALFVHSQGLSTKNPLTVEVANGLINLTVLNDSNLVEVDMGQPVFADAEIPFISTDAGINSNVHNATHTLNVLQQEIEISTLSMGNPHAVICTEDVTQAPVDKLGNALQNHPAFPEQVNVGFMQVIDRTHIKLRVFERGVGETLACGTGACAAVVAGIRRGLLNSDVTVDLPGGQLSISWSGSNTDWQRTVLMTGPAQSVYTGEIELV